MPSRFMVFTLANVGLPGTSGFVGEFLAAPGRLPGQPLGRLLRHDRRHPVGALHALALQPRDLRAAGEAEPQGRSPTSTGARSRSSRRSSCSSSGTASCRGRCSTASPPRPTPSSRATRRRCRRRRPRAAARSRGWPAMNPALAIPAFGPAAAGDHPRRRRARARPRRRLSAARARPGSSTCLALGLLAAALVAVLALPAGRVTTFNGAFVVDPSRSS